MFDIAKMSEEEKETIAERLRVESEVETFADMSWTISAIAVALDLGYSYYKENPEEMCTEDIEKIGNIIEILQSCSRTLESLY